MNSRDWERDHYIGPPEWCLNMFSSALGLAASILSTNLPSMESTSFFLTTNWSYGL